MAKIHQSTRLSGVRVVNIYDLVVNVPGQSLAGLRSAAAAVGIAGKDSGIFTSGVKKAGAALGGLIFGGVGDVLNLCTSPFQGRWCHQRFAKVRFKDTGRNNGGHPHSMELYEYIMLEKPTELELDFQDRVFKSETEDEP